jgi:SNF2 family DNA or RNA helicase
MKLHDYQKRAVQFCLDNPACYLAMDMGLGKTAVALTVVAQLNVKAFVFAPLRPAMATWPEEIKKWTPQLSYYVCHGPEKSLYGLETCDIIIMNYEGLKWFSEQSGKWLKRLVIFDESSMFKSHSTSRFKILKRSLTLWKEYKICLSATPAPNKLDELWSQYYILDRGERLEKNISSFRDKYCISFSYPGMAFTKYTVDPRFTQDIYDKVAPITYRLKAEDYLDMPDITYNTIKCKLTPALKKQYSDFENSFFAKWEDEKAETEAASTAQLSMQLRQFVQGGIYTWPEGDTLKDLKDRSWKKIHNIKLNALKELIEVSSGHPILCPIQFQGELEVIRKAFGDVPIIAGGTSSSLALKYIEQWNAGKVPLLLCHPASLSHGVNLQAGGHILLWYGLTWSLEQYIQLNGRLYRQGQEHAVIIHHLVMEDTIDEVVLQALQDKDANQQKFLNYLREYKHARS